MRCVPRTNQPDRRPAVLRAMCNFERDQVTRDRVEGRHQPESPEHNRVQDEHRHNRPSERKCRVDVSRVSAHQPVMRRMPARKVGRSTRMHNPAVVGVFHEIRVNDPKNDLEPSVHLFFPIRTRGVFGATCGRGSRCPYIGLLQTDIACSPSMARALLSRVSGTLVGRYPKGRLPLTKAFRIKLRLAPRWKSYPDLQKVGIARAGSPRGTGRPQHQIHFGS